MASDQLTAGLAAMDVNTRLLNFPLSRELRDHIYGYLLHSDYTRVVRERTTGPANGEGPFSRQAYKFHTNILAVNKVIHHETEEYLYKNNVFVVASAEWHETGFPPGNSLFTAGNYAPIITENRAAKMRHHSLRLHLNRGQNQDFDYTSFYHLSGKPPLRSCLLLAKDFHALCVQMRCQVAEYPGFAVVVEEDPGMPHPLKMIGWDDAEDKVFKSTRLKVQFLDTPYRTGDVKMQRKMLALLRDNIHCAAMRVTFSGVLPQNLDRIQHIKDVMAPILINRHPSDWIRFEVLRKAKELVDDEIAQGELYLAEESYVTLMVDTGSCIQAQINAPQTTSLFPSAVQATAMNLTYPTIKPFDILRVDIALTLVYLQLKLGDMDHLFTTMENFGKLRKRFEPWIEEMGLYATDSYEGVDAVCEHFAILAHLYLEHRIRGSTRPMSVRHLIEGLLPHKQFPYQAHDLAILNKVRNKRDLAILHLPLHKCSASVLGPRIFSFHKSPGVPKIPASIVGLKDMASLSRLDDKTKTAINDLQRLHEQKVTEWE
jgi:hypothetical protein